MRALGRPRYLSVGVAVQVTEGSPVAKLVTVRLVCWKKEHGLYQRVGHQHQGIVQIL